MNLKLQILHSASAQAVLKCLSSVSNLSFNDKKCLHETTYQIVGRDHDDVIIHSTYILPEKSDEKLQQIQIRFLLKRNLKRKAAVINLIVYNTFPYKFSP